MCSPPKPVCFKEQTGVLEALPPADVPFCDQGPPQSLAQICCISPNFASAGVANGAATKPGMDQKHVYFGHKMTFFQRNFLTRSETLPLS